MSDLARFPLVIPVIELETMISVRLATLELHKFSADMLKLIEMPTCTSKQPVRGKIIGAVGQYGCGRT